MAHDIALMGEISHASCSRYNRDTSIIIAHRRYHGSTAEEQKQWWKENGGNLKWDEKRGLLVLPKKE